MADFLRQNYRIYRLECFRNERIRDIMYSDVTVIDNIEKKKLTDSICHRPLDQSRLAFVVSMSMVGRIPYDLHLLLSWESGCVRNAHILPKHTNGHAYNAVYFRGTYNHD